MALFLKQDEQRSQLQEKIAADISQRLNSSSIESKKAQPAFLDNQKKTTSLAWAWIAIVAIVVMIGCVWVWLKASGNL